MSTSIPTEGSTYYTLDGLNTINLSLLNPLGYFANYAITITAPVYADLAATLGDEPNFTLADLLLWCQPFQEFMQDEESSSLYNLFMAFLNIAKIKVKWEIIQEETIWKRLIALYIGHYMEINIRAIKDEENKLSLIADNDERKEETRHLEYTVGSEIFKDLRATIYGSQFWYEYEPYGRFVGGLWGTSII
jgi:hypothetical protein